MSPGPSFECAFVQLRELINRPRCPELMRSLGLDRDAPSRDVMLRLLELSNDRVELALECLECDQERGECLAFLRLFRTRGVLSRAHPDAPLDDGSLPLMRVSAAGDVCSTMLMLLWRANPWLQDERGLTAADHARCPGGWCDSWGMLCGHALVRSLLLEAQQWWRPGASRRLEVA